MWPHRHFQRRNTHTKSKQNSLTQPLNCLVSDQSISLVNQDTYFSRRDQYKVMKALKDSHTHVYLRKTLYFDEIAI